MQQVRLGRSGLVVSQLAFGTWQLGGDWGPTDTAEAMGAIRRAVDEGVTLFDTAQAYGFGQSEQLLSPRCVVFPVSRSSSPPRADCGPLTAAWFVTQAPAGSGRASTPACGRSAATTLTCTSCTGPIPPRPSMRPRRRSLG